MKTGEMSGNALQWAREHVEETKALILEMAAIESPSDDQAALGRWAAWFEGRAEHWGGKVERAPGGHLLCRFFGSANSQGLLVLGHYDTVWPAGTSQKMPIREDERRLWGPGVLDMKGGIAMFLMGMRGLRELGAAAGPVLLQLNADEEIGSHSSRALTESNARSSRAVLVLEPGTGLDGKLKTERKGVGEYRIRVKGKAAHAGVDFKAGASAVLELSRQLLHIAGLTDSARGITVNPGVIAGGSRPNVIAAEAEAHIDIRVARMDDVEDLTQRFLNLKPFDERCSIEVEGGLNRPPMARTQATVELFELARRIGEDLGVETEESSTGGGSDGNFTAASGVPTLDGLGAIGEGAHASNECMLIDRIADRIALLAMLVQRLA